MEAAGGSVLFEGGFQEALGADLREEFMGVGAVLGRHYGESQEARLNTDAVGLVVEGGVADALFLELEAVAGGAVGSRLTVDEGLIEAATEVGIELAVE